MLHPNKYTNIPTSILGVGAVLVAQLQSEPAQKYRQLEDNILMQLGESAKNNIPLSLILLYSLGKIRYYQKEDVVELIQLETK